MCAKIRTLPEAAKPHIRVNFPCSDEIANLPKITACYCSLQLLIRLMPMFLVELFVFFCRHTVSSSKFFMYRLIDSTLNPIRIAVVAEKYRQC